jgi:hypothetical protein
MSTDQKGRWVEPPGGGAEWEGPEEWAEPHGAATVVFRCGTIDRVEGCLMPDGTRRTIQWRGSQGQDLPASYEEREGQHLGYRHGEIDIGADDVRFIPGRCLEDDLMNSPRIRQRVQDAGFALRLYAALCWIDWYCRGSFRHDGLTENAHFLAKLRGSGSFMDFTHPSFAFPEHPFPDLGVVAGDVAAEMAKLGWRSHEPWYQSGWPADLYDDITRSERIRALVQDRHFAEDLYRALCHVVWLKDDRPDANAPYFASQLVADLRGLGEKSFAFCGTPDEGTVAPRIATELAALGWTQSRPKEYG